MYCAANTEDFRLGIEHVKRKYPNAPLFAAGYNNFLKNNIKYHQIALL